MASKTFNRETYLHSAVSEIRPLFKSAGYRLPTKIHVSVGWAGGISGRIARGQCWARSGSSDRKNHLFIAPTVEDTQEVLTVLTHELVHAYDDCQNGHRKEFTRVAKDVGLIGPVFTTATAGG